MRVCVTVPGVPVKNAPAIAGRLRYLFDGCRGVEVAVVCGTKYGCPDTAAIRIIFESGDIYNKHIEKVKQVKGEHPRATVRAEFVQCGGGYTNIGSATVAAMADCSVPAAVAGGRYCCGTHAVYWMKQGFVIEARYWNKADYMWSGTVYFVSVSFSGMVRKKVGTFRASGYDNIEVNPLGEPLYRNMAGIIPVIETAMRKARCYHCRCHHTW